MDSITFSGPRWTIVHGAYDGVEGHAVDTLYKAVQQHVPYILTVSGSDAPPDSLRGFHCIFVGTVDSNAILARAVAEGRVARESRRQGYSIAAGDSPFDPERQAVFICGADGPGVLYGVLDFEHYYCDSTGGRELHVKEEGRTPFTERLSEHRTSSAPAIEFRGLWTWGHVIYDYRRYIDHMACWKMNLLTIWNDHVPVNAARIVEYAHSRGVGIVWGFTWCWGENVDPSDDEQLVRWTERVVDTYETQYAALGADGIYFQTFTETNDKEIGGASIGQLVSQWVNHIARALLERHPGLWIQFGVHATSIGSRYPELSDVDERVSIVWEDVGSFPFHYDPGCVDDIDETLRYTDAISGLRGSHEEFGMVLKGMTKLNWHEFEHQKGRFILGETKRNVMEAKAVSVAPAWKYNQACWLENYGHLMRTVGIVAKKDLRRVNITGLAEDGLWEERMWYPVALFAEALWDPYRSAAEMIAKVAMTKDAHLA